MPLDLVNLTIPELPGGSNYCFENWQRLAVDLFSRTKGTLNLSAGVGWNFGATTPTATQRAFPWLNTTNGLAYVWSQQYGLWISPMDPADRELGIRKIWKPAAGQVESAVWSLDGGDGTDPSVVSPTAVTGAAWQVDHDMDGRSFFGIGAVPGTSTPVVNIGAGQSGGEGQHVLTSDENGPHTHPTPDPTEKFVTLIAGAGASSTDTVGTGSFPVEPNTGSSGLGTPHNTMPPYWGCWFIKPTARQFYVITG